MTPRGRRVARARHDGEAGRDGDARPRRGARGGRGGARRDRPRVQPLPADSELTALNRAAGCGPVRDRCCTGRGDRGGAARRGASPAARWTRPSARHSRRSATTATSSRSTPTGRSTSRSPRPAGSACNSIRTAARFGFSRARGSTWARRAKAWAADRAAAPCRQCRRGCGARGPRRRHRRRWRCARGRLVRLRWPTTTPRDSGAVAPAVASRAGGLATSSTTVRRWRRGGRAGAPHRRSRERAPGARAVAHRDRGRRDMRGRERGDHRVDRAAATPAPAWLGGLRPAGAARRRRRLRCTTVGGWPADARAA